jgi:uridine phosphorylase
MAAGLLEDVIAMGSKKFIACGGAGVLDKTIGMGQIVIPKNAVRDEGTSYHYLPPSRDVDASQEGISAIQEVLEIHDIPYVVGKTWTTDGIYRETPEKISLRKAEGCLTVEMECAAFFAVAGFRNVVFAQLLYGGDDLSSSIWDSRD